MVSQAAGQRGRARPIFPLPFKYMARKRRTHHRQRKKSEKWQCRDKRLRRGLCHSRHAGHGHYMGRANRPKKKSPCTQKYTVTGGNVKNSLKRPSYSHNASSGFRVLVQLSVGEKTVSPIAPSYGVVQRLPLCQASSLVSPTAGNQASFTSWRRPLRTGTMPRPAKIAVNSSEATHGSGTVVPDTAAPVPVPGGRPKFVRQIA